MSDFGGRVVAAVERKKSIERIGLVIVVAAVAIFCFATLRSGHEWGGDFSQYIHHAKNISEGKSYSDIGYIYNPARPNIGPRTYPPVYPFLLAPVYKVFGLNLKAMKAETVFIFLACLFTIAACFRRDISQGLLVPFIAVLGFNHQFWGLKEQIISEMPFILFSYLALLVIDRAASSDVEDDPPLSRAILAGLLIYLAYGTRSIGIVLLPALLLSDIIRIRRVSRFSVIAAAIFILLALVQGVIIGGDGSYIEQFLTRFEFNNLIYNVKDYLSLTAIQWDNGYSLRLTAFLFYTISTLSLAGLILRLRERVTVYELFFFIYLFLAFLWPTYIGYRLFMPIFPLYVFYSFVALGQGRSLLPGVSGYAVYIVLALVVAMSYVGVYSIKDYGPVPSGVELTESRELFEVIKRETPSDAVFVFRKPRVLALYTGRSASVYHKPEEQEKLLEYFKEINADYLIVGKLDDEYIVNFVSRYANLLTVVFMNTHFRVYKLSYPDTGSTIRLLL